MPETGKFTRPMADFLARLEYHAADVEGRILRGWHWDISARGGLAVPTASIRGLKDLPGLRLFIPDIEENFRPARHTDARLTINVLVATQRTKGMVEFLRAIEKVIDALQRSAADPAVPKALEGTLRHFDWKLTDNFILENSINGHVSISAHPAVGEVGSHR